MTKYNIMCCLNNKNGFLTVAVAGDIDELDAPEASIPDLQTASFSLVLREIFLSAGGPQCFSLLL